MPASLALSHFTVATALLFDANSVSRIKDQKPDFTALRQNRMCPIGEADFRSISTNFEGKTFSGRGKASKWRLCAGAVHTVRLPPPPPRENGLNLNTGTRREFMNSQMKPKSTSSQCMRSRDVINLSKFLAFQRRFVYSEAKLTLKIIFS